MNTENPPKLTLGLKKKRQDDQSGNQAQSQTEKRPKLSLGLRKKAVHQQPKIGIFDPTVPQETRSKLTFGLKKKQTFINPHVIVNPPGGIPQKKSTITMPKTRGKLEVNIKMTALPNWVETIKRGWRRICINADGQIVQMKVRPRVWNKLLQANEDWPMWIASITGKIGPRFKNGFELVEPAIQVYEKTTNSPDPSLEND
ncbi:MAG: hypothetical protein DRR16_17615 [Candidatus Parabeggiatoa sp. nov. 3]|nr:MAG: hypothetical protein DRR00_02900 [Gammaproteobacteria bacterium]RKZ69154.1 MAG: hypothetical protein DRQ99_01720 [Gammaproteobacteria bacterium]RKZ83306.1 MAG: hypothetical protein DRR16_17615 [Gammaproteobacteria bacterium]